MKKTVLLIGFILVVVISLLWTLFEVSVLPNREKNGFEREWNMGELTQINSVSVSPVVKEIAGISKERLYLVGIDPRWAIEVDKKFQFVDTHIFKLPPVKGNYIPNHVSIDSPKVAIYGYNMGALWNGSLDTLLFDYQKLPVKVITAMTQFSEDRLIFRSFSERGIRQEFGIWNRFNADNKEKQKVSHDSRLNLLHDGNMQLDRESNRIIFIEMFSNSIFCLDSNLNIVYTASTIDTIKSPNLETRFINENGQSKLLPANSRTLVNRDFAIYGGKIFVLSALMSDNEEIRLFNSYDVIDVYNSCDGSYRGSLKIPRPKNGVRIRSLAFDKDILYTLNGDKLSAFALPNI